MDKTIEYNNVSNILKNEFPDFIFSDLCIDNATGEILEYIVAGEFAYYIIKSIEGNNIEKLKKCFEFIELLYINGTIETGELATMGYLENLQNITGGSNLMEKYEIIYDFLGEISRKWWDKLNNFWNGNYDALKE